jgi:hypothetical protein
MNKDDIITIEISDNIVLGSQAVYACLAWDKSKFGVGGTNEFDDIEDAKLTAIGNLWQEYGDEIIAHIQDKTKEELRVHPLVGETKEVIVWWTNGGIAKPEV